MFAFLSNFLSWLFSLIYDLIVSRPVTNYTYSRLLSRLQAHSPGPENSLLDIGVGTGTALAQIIRELPPEMKVLGVDIDPNYVQQGQKRFQGRKNVEIRLQDFLTMGKEAKSFDFIVFSSSFMLMGDKPRALEVARSLLKPKGRVFFILTLFERRKRLVERVKPLLKYALTIDFGEALTEGEFLGVLEKAKVRVSFMERIERKMVPCFRLFRYFLVEGEFE